MNTFSKKILTFLSTLMGVGLLYVAVLIFVGQTSNNTYHKDKDNAVQKVMADLNFYQDTGRHEYKQNDDALYNQYSSDAYPVPDIYGKVKVGYGETVKPPALNVVTIPPPPPPPPHSH